MRARRAWVDVRDLGSVTDSFAVPPLAARCARHEDAPAEALCGRCGDQLCRTCLPVGSELCAPCAAREPFHDVLPLAWERDDGRPRVARVLPTLGALVFLSASRAAVFARGGVRPAARFALCVSLPLACLSLVVPVTRRLMFGPYLSITTIGQPTPLDLALDLARAVGAGVLLAPLATGSALAAVLLASGFRPLHLWVRHALYWSWLPPTLMLTVSMVAWAGPPDSPYAALGFTPVMSLPMAWWFSLLFTAHRARRMGWAWALLTALLGGAGWTFGTAASSVALAALNPNTPAVGP
jgi:hypothetical protein